LRELSIDEVDHRVAGLAPSGAGRWKEKWQRLPQLLTTCMETLGLVRPRIEVVIRKISEHSTRPKPLRMRWVHDHDAQGHDIMRIQWMEEAEYNKPLNIPNRRSIERLLPRSAGTSELSERVR
jgi:hypothetical protein